MRGWSDMSAVVLLGLLAGTVGADVALPVTASSVHDPRYMPEFAVDGDPATRWASQGADGEWLALDLGRTLRVAAVSIHWEHAYPAKFAVETSTDGEDWTVVQEAAGVDGPQSLDLTPSDARHVRVRTTEPGPFNITSIWEISSPDEDVLAALGGIADRISAARAEAMRETAERFAQTVSDMGAEEIVFAIRKPGVDGHWYGNFGYYARSTGEKCYRTGSSKLCALNAKTGDVRVIFEDAEGSIRDPKVHYDARKILFSYLRAGTESYHLYEINVDGTGLTQITDGNWDDIEPTYLPGGGIMFASSRCFRWVNCWLTPVATLYRCDGDGGNVRMISCNVEHDNTPWVLPDGRVLYMRWEYVDRSQVHYHHLWTCNPDGTEQMVFYGNMIPGIAMLDAKPIPGTRKIVSIFSPGHGQHEHQGPVTILDPGDGPDNPASARTIAHANNYRDPYPLSESMFLVARGAEIVLMDGNGNTRPVYQLSGDEISEGLWA
ncbi:MAG TPA: discoidin domain-containing protein, partial [Armatimonadota bacterium]|nr:discoidin domain-containing protein [Armatimonadota bacterium]